MNIIREYFDIMDQADADPDKRSALAASTVSYLEGYDAARKAERERFEAEERRQAKRLARELNPGWFRRLVRRLRQP